MKNLILARATSLCIICFVPFFIKAQTDYCHTVHNPYTRDHTIPTCGWTHFSPQENEEDLTQVKKVRITFHVFQKSDGSDNFPNNQNSINYLTDTLFSWAKWRYWDMVEMNLTTTSPYIEDSRVTFELEDIFFHQDDYGWEIGSREIYSQLYKDSIYDEYVTNNASVTYKTTSIHVFMGETWPGHGVSSSDRRYVFISGPYENYLDNNYDTDARLLAHELGHNLQLHHTYCCDDCNDTPNHDDCWCHDTCSNNIMDYNCVKRSLTECQIGKMHWALLGYNSNVSDCYIDETTHVAPPYSTGFESGPDNHWKLSSSSECGLIRVTGSQTPHGGSAHLIMHSSLNGNYATNEAWLHLDLDGESDVELEFWWKETADETHTADGVYISDDSGGNFEKIYNLSGGSSTYTKVNLDLSYYLEDNEMDHTSNVVVKFQQYDNYVMPTDGIAIDDIEVCILLWTSPILGPFEHCVDDDEEYQVAALEGAVEYDWATTVGSGLSIDEDGSRFVETSASSEGYYTLKVRAKNECGDWGEYRSRSIWIEDCGSKRIMGPDLFTIKPNPTNNYVDISLNLLSENYDEKANGFLVEIYNQSNILLKQEMANGTSIQIFMGDLANGSYIARIQYNGFIYSYQIIVQH